MKINITNKTIVKSLVPTFNSMVCFEVTPKSYHQVAEIFTKDKTRLSVGGWFHGRSPERPPKYIEQPPVLQPPKNIAEGLKQKLSFIYEINEL